MYHFDAYFFLYYQIMGWDMGPRKVEFCDNYMRIHFTTGTHASEYALGTEHENPISTDRIRSAYSSVLRSEEMWNNFQDTKKKHKRILKPNAAAKGSEAPRTVGTEPPPAAAPLTTSIVPVPENLSTAKHNHSQRKRDGKKSAVTGGGK